MLVFQLLVNQEKSQGHTLDTRKNIYLNNYKLSENNPWTKWRKDPGWRNHTKELMITTIIYLLLTYLLIITSYFYFLIAQPSYTF